MGQAKQRKAEIEALKATKTTVRFLAIRHCEDGEREFAFAEATLGKPVNNKNALLRHICMNDWVHNPPVDAIAEYLIQTNTYQTMKQFNPDAGYIINFHEVDAEYTRQLGQKTYACREIVSMGNDALKDYAHKFAEELKAGKDYSVKEYA